MDLTLTHYLCNNPISKHGPIRGTVGEGFNIRNFKDTMEPTAYFYYIASLTMLIPKPQNLMLLSYPALPKINTAEGSNDQFRQFHWDKAELGFSFDF